jgi:hypothetical protein
LLVEAYAFICSQCFPGEFQYDSFVHAL